MKTDLRDLNTKPQGNLETSVSKSRSYYFSNFEYRKRKKLHLAERYTSDPEFRERQKLYAIKEHASSEYKERRRTHDAQLYAANSKFRKREILRKIEYSRKIQEKLSGVPRPKSTVCAICEKKISGPKIMFDHDHKSGKFRGWLCISHNIGLGMFGDSAKTLEKAIQYLRGLSGLGNGTPSGDLK
jgi:hypothetical protein